MTITNRMLIALLLAFSLGCQQTNIEFTEHQPPTVAEFAPLNGAPTLSVPTHLSNNLSAIIPSGQVEQVSLHQLPKRQSTLIDINLVLLNPNRPLHDIDVLQTALQLNAIALAKRSSLSCIETLQISARIHHISLAMTCPAEEVNTAIALLIEQWQPSSFDQLDMALVQRQLKLSKHINAYSGAEIDRTWAKLILGADHPYTQSLNNPKWQNELSMAQLAQIQSNLLQGAQWHLLLSEPIDNALTTELTPLLAKLPRTSTPITTKALTNTEMSASNDKIYLIDAPSAVQTQVRVGYRLPSGLVAAQQCQEMASWLGRSFSGRLYYDLRETRGLTYGVYGRCYHNPQATTLKFYGNTKIQHTSTFIKGIIDHLTLAQSQAVKAPEVSALRTYLLSQYQLKGQTPRSAQAYYINELTLGATQTQIQQHIQQIEQLDSAQLNDSANALMQASPIILIRGDAEVIQPHLQTQFPQRQVMLIAPTD
ncbi:insulinase family protein [Shewanella waksmanii]|uniref:insulinase family protein n=1 Tax=Shewanella waksmanii TaxID=213783 RepID=UPI0004B2F2C8|nr:insulinase family protein [Shewanella waksmanii]